MMEFPPPPRIMGYRHLTDTELALVNEAKALGEQVRTFIDKLRAVNLDRSATLIDRHWLNIATTDLQKGFMVLVRSITKPTTF